MPTLARGDAILLYLRVGERSLEVGEELFYTYAVPLGAQPGAGVERHVVFEGSLRSLEASLALRIERCEGDSWDAVFERMREFFWHEAD